MSTGTPPPAEPREPTQQDGLAVGAAAAAAAQQAPPEQRQQAASDAVTQFAQERNLRISDEDKQQIAGMAAELASNMTIDKLERQGAFNPPPPAAPATVAQGGNGAPPPGTPPTAAPAADAAPPEKESWAKRHGFT